jgi:hypothetical protein
MPIIAWLFHQVAAYDQRNEPVTLRPWLLRKFGSLVEGLCSHFTPMTKASYSLSEIT